MFTFSVITCKRLVSQPSLKLICKNIPLIITSLKFKCQLAIPELKKNESVLNLFNAEINTKHSDIVLINKIISQSRGPDGIPWEEVIKKLKALDVRNTNSTILQSLLRLQNVDDGVNFYNYWIKKGEKFAIIDLINFLRLISSRKDLIQENETLIKYIYDNIKDYLLTSDVILGYLLEVFAEVPYCFYDFIECMSQKKSGAGNHYLVIKALELDKPEIAWNVIKSGRLGLPETFSEVYMNFFIRMAKKGQFTPELVTQLTESYADLITALEDKNLDSLFNILIKIANKQQNDYIWSAKTCEVNDIGVCSNCKFTLIDRKISETEFNEMKKDFLSQVGLFHHSVFLSTSHSEVNKFITFLNNCKPYNIVIDALNVIHKRGYVKFQDIFQLIKLLVKDGLSLLIIGRQHISRAITSAYFLRRKEYRNKVQYFFPSDLSDDDIFILYAALHAGLGTHFLSNDILSCYNSRLSVHQRDIFIKWKIYHQYIPIINGFRPPRRHLGVPQLTSTPDQNGKKFIWHISSMTKENNVSKLSCLTPLKWTCVQAEKKETPIYNNNT